MKAQKFIDWMETVGISKAADIVRLLGISRNHAQIMVKTAKAGNDVEIKLSLALAMSAVANGLEPWAGENMPHELGAGP